MKNEPFHPEQSLRSHISGFHQYRLAESPRLSYVSENLCLMLDRTPEELLEQTQDGYGQCLHPADREKYAGFLRELGSRAQTRTLQYRLLKKDGSMLFVSDTAVSYPADGGMMADCVLTDITELKDENRNLRFLNDTMPCGFVKYTCEKPPRVTYYNRQALEILRFPRETDGGFDFLENFCQNIYTMIPMEERGRLSRYLDRVSEQGAPLAGEITALRCDGTRAYLFGWVTKTVNEQGEAEFQSAFMDITQRRLKSKEQESSRYLTALTEVYDKIFEFNLGSRTVKCLYGQNSPMFRWLEKVPMQMEEATENWITATACESDRERLRSFFQRFARGALREPDGKPPQNHLSRPVFLRNHEYLYRYFSAAGRRS